MRSYESRGRRAEEECALRTPFQRDRDRIVHTKPFRRLKGKTQVFIDPAGDHYRTRMTHTLETTAISRVVARALRLNEDLVEAIGLGHDLGHTPVRTRGRGRARRGAPGAVRPPVPPQRAFAPRSTRPALNLTHEVRDGILNHTGPNEPETLEGKIVRLVDRIAYINHDIDDAVRSGVLSPDALPEEEITLLGETGWRRIDPLVHDLVETSERGGDIRQSQDIGGAMLWLRSFMFDHVYLAATRLPSTQRARVVREDLRAPRRARRPVRRDRPYVAGMTDRFALAYADEL